MAKRRMFSLDVIDTDSFLDMPHTVRLLYYDLGMRADDYGFITPHKVLRLTNSSVDDLKVLIAKQFIHTFEDGVVVIRHWHKNNYLQSDRLQDSNYSSRIPTLLKDNVYEMYTPCIQNVYAGKDRIGKDRKEKNRIHNTLNSYPAPLRGDGDEINDIIKLFEPINPSYARLFPRKQQREAVERLLKIHGSERLKQMISALPAIVVQAYAPKPTTPIQLEEQMGKLILFIQQKKTEGKVGRYVARIDG